MYAAISGIGGSFRISFTDVLSGSYALGTAVKNTTALLTQNKAAEPDRKTSESSALAFGAIYPNPGNGRAFISVESPKSQKLDIKLVNVSGQMLYAQQEQVAAGVSLISIPLHRYLPGTYMIRINNTGGKLLNAQQYIKK